MISLILTPLLSSPECAVDHPVETTVSKALVCETKTIQHKCIGQTAPFDPEGG